MSISATLWLLPNVFGNAKVLEMALGSVLLLASDSQLSI